MYNFCALLKCVLYLAFPQNSDLTYAYYQKSLVALIKWILLPDRNKYTGLDF